VQGGDLFGQGGAEQVRHDHVGEQQVGAVGGLLAGQVEGGGAVVGGQHPVAVAGQQASAHLPQGGFVLDQQYGLAVSAQIALGAARFAGGGEIDVGQVRVVLLR
jgi:hypothetical protein